jgi:protein-disulfide isomerase
MKRTCLQKNTTTDEHNSCESPDCQTGWHPAGISFDKQHFDPKEFQEVISCIRKKITYIFLLIFVLFFSSCKSYDKNHDAITNQKILAYVDSIPIMCDSVDYLIRQELFDELNRIHLIRKITLNEVIDDKLLLLEASKQHITVKKLTEKLFADRINDANLEEYARIQYPQNKIPELRKTIVYYDLKSAEGQEILITRFKKFIMNQYVDSLRKSHQIIIKLEPPKSPKITIDNLIVHYKGNLNSKVTFLIISDFECDMCREYNPVFEKLYSEYKEKVRFGFTHYGSYVSKPAIASECANSQGKFWEMHDSIFNSKLLPDSIILFRMAKNMGLNMNGFKDDFGDKSVSVRIKDNLLKLESAGVYGTPTIMINNRLLFNSASINEIEKNLKEELEKVN